MRQQTWPLVAGFAAGFIGAFAVTYTVTYNIAFNMQQSRMQKANDILHKMNEELEDDIYERLIF